MSNPKPQIGAASQTGIQPEVMTKRRITLPDGRYLIFFEFSPAPQLSGSFKNEQTPNV
jgi:hypothetical protein